MPGIRVVADSACDLPSEVIAEYRLTIVPLTIRVGPDDATEASPQEFWAMCRASSALPETAAPAPGAFVEAFRRLAADGADGVLCMNLSSKLSATIESARAAAREVADLIAVRVVDTLSVSVGMGLQVIEAARMAEAGKSLAEVADAAEAAPPRVRVYAALDTLENLKKGGRIGGATALLGSMLSIKPVIEVAGGVVEQESKQRTRKTSLRYLCDKVAEANAINPIDQLAVGHGDASDIDAFLRQVTEVVPAERVLVCWVGAVIGSHAGPGVIGLGWSSAAV
jgi:DegV family protein with EDD domain